MGEQIIISFITVGIPSLTTLLTYLIQRRESRMSSSKLNITQLIMEDEFGWQAFKQLPTNHDAILHEYDVYTKNGGNSDTHERVEAYKKWYIQVQTEIANSQTDKKAH